MFKFIITCDALVLHVEKHLGTRIDTAYTASYGISIPAAGLLIYQISRSYALIRRRYCQPVEQQSCIWRWGILPFFPLSYTKHATWMNKKPPIKKSFTFSRHRDRHCAILSGDTISSDRLMTVPWTFKNNPTTHTTTENIVSY